MIGKINPQSGTCIVVENKFSEKAKKKVRKKSICIQKETKIKIKPYP